MSRTSGGLLERLADPATSLSGQAYSPAPDVALPTLEAHQFSQEKELPTMAGAVPAHQQMQTQADTLVQRQFCVHGDGH